MKSIYLAYGSNLSVLQMAYRCPTAEIVGKVVVPDYKLEFRGRKGFSYATIVPEKGSSVSALLWSIQPKDEKALDRYEGFPKLYRKEVFKVELEEKTVEAMVYIMNEGKPIEKPSDSYYEIIKEGYERFGFDKCALEKAYEETT